jgi:hypothetical protein
MCIHRCSTIDDEIHNRIQNYPGYLGCFLLYPIQQRILQLHTKTTTRITDTRQENKFAYRCAHYYPIIAIQQRRPHGKITL